jgi:hypothetical protein
MVVLASPLVLPVNILLDPAFISLQCWLGLCLCLILANALILDYQIYQRGSGNSIHHCESHHVPLLVSKAESPLREKLAVLCNK